MGQSKGSLIILQLTYVPFEGRVVFEGVDIHPEIPVTNVSGKNMKVIQLSLHMLELS
jgi:hypothetical protein